MEWKKCLSSTAVKRSYLSNVHKIGGTHVQFVNNHYAKFECRGMKIVGVTDYTNQTPKAFRMEKMSKFNNPQNEKICIKCSRNGRCTFQCVNNHCAKFEYKGMKTVGVTDYTNQTPSKHFGRKNV